MSLEALTGTSYGPIEMRIAPEKAAEFVDATGDDPGRWSSAAPPAYAGALLFAVAPAFIHAPEVGEHTKVLVHSDQRFQWHGPLTLGAAVSVTGSVQRVRERAGLNFVTFDVAVDGRGGERLIDSTSTFLMGSTAAAEPGPDHGEPAVGVGSRNDPVTEVGEVVPGVALPPITRAASRLDLVRYAAASGDFNPIHFDHEAARAAGLDGVVVHGLLMAAWLSQLAAAAAPGDAPLREMKLRFRNALRPATESTAAAAVDSVDDAGAARLSLTLRADGVDLITAAATTRGGP